MRSIPSRATTIIAVIVCSWQLAAQQTPAAPIDRDRVLAGLSASYYHPDEIASIDCGVNLDFSDLAKVFGGSADAVKALSGLPIRAIAVRGQTPKTAIVWPADTKMDKDAVERGLQQMVAGFFQMYWSSFAAPPINPPVDRVTVEHNAAGGYTVRQNTGALVAVEDLDSDFVPTQAQVTAASLKATVLFHFSPSEKPEPGDLRRLTSVDVSSEVGASTIQVKVGVDYQTIEDVAIPRHIAMNMGGAIAFAMELTGCSVTKQRPSR